MDLGSFVDAAPPGSTVELAPGRYEGPLRITKPIRIRGAGDLSRISGRGISRVIDVTSTEGSVNLESILLEDGHGETGAGLFVGEGRVSLHNVHIQHCKAGSGGGAIHVSGGILEAKMLRVNDVSGDRGGAIWVQGDATMRMHDCEIIASEALQGGALAIEGAARVSLEAVTVKKARATTPAGGQALFVAGTTGARPSLELRRVRLEGTPFGIPLYNDPEHSGEVALEACDMPRMVASVLGVIDRGENRWR